MTTTQPLIVPMVVEALVVNDLLRLTLTNQFFRASMDYANLQNAGNAQVSAASDDGNFTLGGYSSFYDGIYLKWRLPAAFTRGQQSASGETIFPYVPNRWLVVRTSSVPGSAASWVLESDYTTETEPDYVTATDMTSLWLPNQNPDGNLPQALYMGRYAEASAYRDSGSWLGLTAIAPGNHVFTAYQPTNPMVFSFVDTNAGAFAGQPEQTLSYMVLGWLSQPIFDPLAAANPDNLASILESLGWSADLASAEPIGLSRTLLYGTVFNVTWQNTTQPLGGAPNGAPLSVAVGNTSVEALTALVTAQGTNVEPQLLEAFQLGLIDQIDQPDGEGLLEAAVARSGFQKISGGYGWTVVNAPGVTTPPSKAELDAERQWLGELNLLQQALDAESQQLAALQRQLYVMWWKSLLWEVNTLPVDDPMYGLSLDAINNQLDPAVEGTLAWATNVQSNFVNDLAGKVPSGDTPPAMQASIAAYAAARGLPSTRVLKQTSAPQFYEPNNPVLMIAGEAASGIVAPRGTLACRFPSEIIRSFILGDRTLAAASLQVPKPFVAIPGFPFLSDVATALLDEFLLLDPNSLPALAAQLDSMESEVLFALCDPRNFQGRYPGQALSKWSVNPWHPLMIVWSAQYYPINYQSAGGPGWVFENGQYVWTSNGLAEEPLPTLSGVIHLTPASTLNMQSSIAAYIAKYPNAPETAALQALSNFIQSDNGWQIISQTLDGFNRQLQLGQAGVFPAPAVTASPQVAQLIGSAAAYPPAVGDIPQQDQPPPPSSFQPWRSGQFFFTSLSIVDEWGQVVNPILALDTDLNVYTPPEMLPEATTNTASFVVGSAGVPPVSSANGPLAITSISPASTAVGSDSVTLTIIGSGFESNATVLWDGEAVTTSFQSATQLTAAVAGTLLTQPGTFTVTVAQTGTALTEGGDSFIQIPPSLLQPARLDFQLLAAPGGDPIFGWLVPNHLDGSLMAYDGQGEMLGILRPGVARDGTAEVCWTAAPFSPYASFGELVQAVPNLGPILQTLKNLETPVFQDFMAAIDETLWTTVPLGAAFDSLRSVLVGRPLAVVSASLQLSVYGEAVMDPSWQYTFDPASPEVNDYQFAIELGNQMQLEDGLIGYFSAGNASFNVVMQAGVPDDGFLKPIGLDGNYLYTSIAAPAPTSVTMLVDPRAAVHATTGILPIASVALPPQFVTSALASMKVVFRINGLLTDEKIISSAEEEPAALLLMPAPSEARGTWSWVENGGEGWIVYPIAANDATARLSGVAPVLRSGFLQLASTFTKNSGGHG